MKKALFFIAILIPVLQLLGQTSDLPTYGYNYQAVIRDAQGHIMPSTAIQLRFQVLNSSDGEPIPPFTVVVFDENQEGKIRTSNRAYDKKIAGVVSDTSQNAEHRVGILHAQENTQNGSPVAIEGTVRVFAIGPIIVGNFLTTSNVPGYAKRAKNCRRSRGAVLGKAISRLAKGEKGMVEMFVERH